MGRFFPNVPGIESLAHQPEVAALLLERAQTGRDAAASVAPVRTGHYRQSLKAKVEELDDGYHGFIYSTDFKAVWIEFGTSTPLPTPKFAPLRKGLEALRE